MTATRRLKKEMGELQANGVQGFVDFNVKEDNLLYWIVKMQPLEPPYNKGAFLIEINFPAEYPFKPPKLLFQTKVYHPNIDEKGQVCLPVVASEHWKPATKINQVLSSLLSLMHEPQPQHALRSEIGEEFIKNYKKFLKAAEDYTKKHAEKREVRKEE